MQVKYIISYKSQKMNKVQEWSNDKGLLTPREIAETLGINKNTVHTRFRSKYAKDYWGVEVYKMPNGGHRKYVKRTDLYKWINAGDYRGRQMVKNT